MEDKKEVLDMDNDQKVVENKDNDQTNEIKEKIAAETENNTESNENTNLEEKPENKPPIKYGILGSEDIPIDKEAVEFYTGNQRIGKMEGFEEGIL